MKSLKKLKTNYIFSSIIRELLQRSTRTFCFYLLSRSQLTIFQNKTQKNNRSSVIMLGGCFQNKILNSCYLIVTERFTSTPLFKALSTAYKVIVLYPLPRLYKFTVNVPLLDTLTFVTNLVPTLVIFT